MIDKIKLALRISSNKLDSEINDLIEAAKLDLKTSGIKKIDETDPLIQQAIKTYCKSNFGLENKNSEKFQAIYENIKNHLALCGDYNGE